MTPTYILDCFFLPGARGKLFAIYYSPPKIQQVCGCVLYIHPFAEELNKSRRMAAIQAREFAKRGFAVLCVDLFGCGDSEGELRDAKWEIWLEDLAACVQWLQHRHDSKLIVWGLRLGALLGAELINQVKADVNRMLLWNPVIKGSTLLTEFLRIQVAAEKMKNNNSNVTTKSLKRKLADEKTLELAGYDITEELAEAIENSSLLDFHKQNCRILWIDINRNVNLTPNTPEEVETPTNLSTKRVLDAWDSRGIQYQYKTAYGEPFWNSGEIIECLEYIKVTSALTENYLL